MFYEVRILNAKGKLKKVISTPELSKTHWESFNKLRLPNLESLSLLREYKKQISMTDYHSSAEIKY